MNTESSDSVALVRGLDDKGKVAEELSFMRAVVQGLADIRGERTITLDKAKKLLGVE